MFASGFFGGRFVAPPDQNKIVISPQSYGKKEVSVETMHISCQSDMYQPVYKNLYIVCITMVFC
jgi:hypothetical protein